MKNIYTFLGKESAHLHPGSPRRRLLLDPPSAAIPAQVAESVANDAYEQERLEEFLEGKIAAGASILGIYPPSEETLKEYRKCREAT